MFKFIQPDSLFMNVSSISAICKTTIPALEIEEKILFINKMDAYAFERIFVQIIAEIARQKGISDAQLAREAWPHQKGAATAWRKMRNDSENPKRLNIEEAVLLAQRLGLSMSDLCGMVQGRLLNLDEVKNASHFQKEKSATKALAVKQKAFAENIEKS